MGAKVFRLNRHTWVKRTLEVLGDNGELEEVEIEFAVRPPRRELQERLEQVYTQAMTRAKDDDVYVEVASHLREVMTPEAVADHVFSWRGIADADGNPVEFSRERLLKAFDEEPILYVLAIEAIQEAIPRRKAEVEKN